MATPAPPPPKPKAPASAKPGLPKPSSPVAKARVAKTFSVKVWDGKGEGDKIIGYGESGMGKTTLFAMMPDPIFIGLDDGGRKISDPRTGKPINVVSGVETFTDVRDALHQKSLWAGHKSVVIDTGTMMNVLAEQDAVANIKTDKGYAVTSIEGFGWGKGYKYVSDNMRLILQDLDPMVRGGINVAILCQTAAINIANAEGLDYLQEGPKLLHNKQVSVRNDYREWADHVLRIGYFENKVEGANNNSVVGKMVSTDTTRVIYTQDARHFVAKSRTLKEPVISFATPDDDSIWSLMFPQ